MNANKFLEIVQSDAWPDVPICREDTELNIFTNYFDASNKARILNLIMGASNVDIIKDANKAKVVRNIGNSLYKRGQYPRALQTYNRSLVYAPRDSEEFGLAVANRSASLYAMGLYEDCLQDINNTFKSEYPKNLYYKIFLRQSKCYLKLNLKHKAEESLKKVTNLLRDQASIEEEITEVNNELQTEIKEEPDPSTTYTFLDTNLKNEENPTFLNASKLVRLEYNKEKGRHLVAKANISKGDVLIKEEPYAFAVTHTRGDIEQPKQEPTETYLKTCATCLRPAASSMPCSVCWKSWYCSAQCEQRAEAHRWECAGAQRNLLTDLQRVCLAILAQATRDAFQTTLQNTQVYGNRLNNHPNVDKLITHKNLIPEEKLRNLVKHAMWLVLYLKHFTEFFDWLYVHPARPDGSAEDLYKFIGGQCFKYFLLIEYNAQDIYTSEVQFDKENIVEVKNDTVACGIFLSSAMLNHSCLANAIRSFHKTTCIVRASEDIKKGSEITIDYLQHILPTNADKQERKKELEKFLVTCLCRLCTDPDYFIFLYPFLCGRCGGEAFEYNYWHVICSVCSLIVVSCRYKDKTWAVEEMIGIAQSNLTNEILDDLYMLLRETFSEYSVPYLQYWQLRWFLYIEERNIEMCSMVCQKIYEILCVILKEKTITMQLMLTHFSAMQSVLFKEKKSNRYRKHYNETKRNIQKSVNLLQLVMGSENIKKYIIHVTKLMDSENIDLDNLLPSGTGPISRRELYFDISLLAMCKLKVFHNILFRSSKKTL